VVGALGESPEEGSEVPEADLSMELQDQLKRALGEYQTQCTKRENSILTAEFSEKLGKTVSDIELLRDKFAEAAVQEIVTTLKSFDPDISKDKLSNDVQSILHADSVVGHLNSQFKGTLRKYVPRCRTEWFADDIEGHLAAKRSKLRLAKEKLCKVVSVVSTQVLTLAMDPTVRVTLLTGSSGALVVGACGGVMGLTSGAAAGTLIGVVPALCTFGLSIPVGATVGGSLGSCAGAVAGATTGMLGAGSCGGLVYTYRVEIRGGMLFIKDRGVAGVSKAKAKALETSSYVRVTATDALVGGRQRSAELARVARLAGAKAFDVASDRAVQASAASAAGGAVLGGTGGGAAGLVAGGVMGAACGVLPAVFTFGLSIPIGAAVGSGAGLCIGVTAGTTTGLVGGGLAGYGAYVHTTSKGER